MSKYTVTYLMYGTSQVVNCCCIQYYQTRKVFGDLYIKQGRMSYFLDKIHHLSNKIMLKRCWNLVHNY